ncbi:Para-hydroxybenzoate--polyprenyltransferase, mitochondrial precursor (PHB:polyprenyltransferase) [Linnemannia zychae]|nr:Para-hydroxybenzoate--polyprenyltransferase, mitochondrial precursor (PHB:polyprenyltransferase) [Linnemannia zychae]
MSHEQPLSQLSSDTHIGFDQPTSAHARHASCSNARIITNITGYGESPRTASMSALEIENIRQTHKINIEGKRPPKPILSFEDCGLPVKMLSNLADKGFLRPRSVQLQTVPAGLCGRDMIISAETGSGKTAGFLIPILAHVYGLSQSSAGATGPFALVLAPTRELASQIEQVAKDIVQGMPGMRTALLVGGQAMANQRHRLSQNIQIAVATPGRLIDILVKHEDITFSNVFCLVLDEVDVMFSLGFGKQVKKILHILEAPPHGRQTIVCSATISKQIQQLVEKHMENPLRIRIGDLMGQKQDQIKAIIHATDVCSPSSKIKHTIMWVENDFKKKELFSLLKDPKYYRPPVLIFVESRVGADLLASAIQAKCPGVKAVSIHGEKSAEERALILEGVVDGTLPVVVATGLLARGLNLHVATVINFDMAPSIIEYVHRVGRGDPEVATKVAARIRGGPKLCGMAWAITFINNDHQAIFSEFANMLDGLDPEQVTPLPSQLKRLVNRDSTKIPVSSQQSDPAGSAANTVKRKALVAQQAHAGAQYTTCSWNELERITTAHKGPGSVREISQDQEQVCKHHAHQCTIRRAGAHVVDEKKDALPSAIIPGTWVDRMPKSVQPYLHLTRIDKPIGTWLLFWPCAWGITMASYSAHLPLTPTLSTIGLFGIGAVIMRGAGCTINDLWDRNIDKKVERTKVRPLASGAVTPSQAIAFLGLQLGAGLAVLTQLNLYSIFLGASSLSLVVSYPAMKRITYWPQVVLGLAFNWGALLGSSAMLGAANWPVALPLYASGVCWTLVYDTIYAHQDKKDDIKIGVKSTALRFGDKTPEYLAAFSAGTVSMLALAGYMNEQGPLFYALSVGGIAAHLAWQLSSVDYENPADCWAKFASNKWAGALVFSGIAGDYLYQIMV